MHTPLKENQKIFVLTTKIKVLKDQFRKGEKTNSSKGKDAWNKAEPKEDEPLTTVIKVKTFNWCIHHKAWIIHKPLSVI